jgi:hypothetical protein
MLRFWSAAFEHRFMKRRMRGMSKTTYIRASVVMALCFGLCLGLSATALAGTAYYGGFDDPPAEAGVPYLTGTPTGPILEAMNPGWKIGVEDGTAIGSFTLNDGSTTLVIPDSAHGTGWVLTAEWDLPAPNAIAGRDHYFYIGLDAGGIDGSRMRFGTEYKDSDGDTVKEFVIRDQWGSNVALAPWTEILIPAGSHVHVRLTCIRGGDTTIPGGDVLIDEYRVNYGPWTTFTNAYGLTSVPLAHPAVGKDSLPHYISFKFRGLGGVIDPTITGVAVPDVNTGNDHDGDTVDDENDLWPGNGDWSTDTDADDLADEWEMANFSDLDEIASGNPDGDSFTNIEEMNNATDPNVYDDVPTMTYLGVLVLLALIVIVAGWRVFRRARA